jgi:hypothetical protein
LYQAKVGVRRASGVAWLSAACAAGLVVGPLLLRGRRIEPSARTIAIACALAGIPFALLAFGPPAWFALTLLAVVGLGFGVVRQIERIAAARLAPLERLDGGEISDAIAHTSGSALAALLVVIVGDTASLAVAGVFALAVGGALVAREAAERRAVTVTDQDVIA